MNNSHMPRLGVSPLLRPKRHCWVVKQVKTTLESSENALEMNPGIVRKVHGRMGYRSRLCAREAFAIARAE